MRSRESNPAGGCTMSEQAPSTLGWVLEDRQPGYEIGRGVGEVVLDLAIMAGGAIKDVVTDFFSRPPQGLPPPPSAAAIPAPQDASVAPPGTEPTPTPAETGNADVRIV